MKKGICLLMTMILAMAALTGCAKKSEEKTTTLPQKITQDNWAASKKYVELSTGIKMAYVEMGDPKGKVVILQHGMTDNSRSWSLAAPYFAEAGYHVYLPDLRGMGKTDAPDGFYTTVTYATDMKAFFDAMGIDKAICIGHSLGSFTVQTFALMFPERVEKMVLVSSIPIKQYMTEAMKRLYHTYVEPLRDGEQLPDGFMDNWYACSFKEDNAEEVEFDKCLNGLKTESKGISKSTWKNILLGLAATDLDGLYTEFDTTIPTLILHGQDDADTINDNQEELCELLKVEDDNFISYEGVGHNIQFEIPEQCSKDILEWLENGEVQ